MKEEIDKILIKQGHAMPSEEPPDKAKYDVHKPIPNEADENIFTLLTTSTDDVSKAVIENPKESGIVAWLSIQKEFDGKGALEFGTELSRLSRQTTWMSNARSSEQAGLQLIKYESECTRFELRYGKDKLPTNDLRISAIKESMPDELFGDKGAFRGAALDPNTPEEPPKIF